MNAVVDRIVQYANRYQLTDVSTGKVLGVFDFDEVTGTVQQVGTEIDKELFDSIADDLATRLVANGGDSKDLIVTFTAATSVENISSKEKHSTIFGKIAKWFTDRISKLKKFTYDSTTKITSTDIDSTIPTTDALENGDITVMNAEYTNSASRAIADKNGKDITTYVATETDPTVPGWAKNATKPTYTKAEVGLGKVDNTADLDKPISTATQNALSAKVDKVSGKGLSTNDYTTAEKNKLAGLASDTVRYGEQTLTEAQKSQARTNIGAGSSDFSGDYNDLSNKPTIPTNYVTTDTTQNITAIKTFKANQRFYNANMDISKESSSNKYSYIAFDDAGNQRAGALGGMQTTDNYCGTYLQARNGQQIRILSNADGTITETHAPTPPDTDSSTQLATTEWVRTNYQEKGYAGINGSVLNDDGNVTDKDGNVVDALYFKVASLSTAKTYVRTYLLAEVAMTNIINEQATVLIHCTTESSTSAPIVTITFDNYSYARLLLPKNIFVTADYKSGTAGATFTVWVKQTAGFMQQVWNVLAQNTRNYTTTSKREWDIFYSNITKATAVTDIDTAPTGYTRIVANNNNRYSNLEENTYLWQQAENAGITWKRYSDNAARAVFRHYDDGTTENFVVQSGGFLFRPLNNSSIKSITVDPAVGALYPEKDSGADLGKAAQRWNNAYIKNIVADSVTADNLPFTSDGLSTGTLGSTGLSVGRDYYIEKTVGSSLISCVIRTYTQQGSSISTSIPSIYNTVVPVIISNTLYFVEVDGAGTIGGSTVPVTFSLKNTSGGTVTNTTVTSGTFKYKRI